MKKRYIFYISKDTKMKLISKWYFILLYIELTIVKFFTAKVSYRIEGSSFDRFKKGYEYIQYREKRRGLAA